MQNELSTLASDPITGPRKNAGCQDNPHPGRPLVTQAITRGVCRYLIDTGLAPLTEFTLANGRRADIVAVGAQGEIVMVEVKSCPADFLGDHKWTDYLGFCDRFFFAVDMTFPQEILPGHAGLMVGDDYGAAITRAAEEDQLSAARRKAVTIRIARQAMMRRLVVADAAGG
ncbi:MAG: MmcB family DNA repair protein [Pseudomonadota bacterium]